MLRSLQNASDQNIELIDMQLDCHASTAECYFDNVGCGSDERMKCAIAVDICTDEYFKHLAFSEKHHPTVVGKPCILRSGVLEFNPTHFSSVYLSRMASFQGDRSLRSYIFQNNVDNPSDNQRYIPDTVRLDAALLAK